MVEATSNQSRQRDQNRAVTLALHLSYPDYTERDNSIGFTPSGNGKSSHVSFFFKVQAEISSFIAFSHSFRPLASSNELGSSTFWRGTRLFKCHSVCIAGFCILWIDWAS